VASSSIFSIDRGPRVVLMMSATACGGTYTLAGVNKTPDPKYVPLDNPAELI